MNKMLKQYLSWDIIVKIICIIIIIVLLVMIIGKVIKPSWLTEVKFEVLLIALAVSLLFPFIGSFEALGVKVSIREQVRELSAWAEATPYYVLGSEHELAYDNAEDQDPADLILAEQYYLNSLEKCSNFWPSIFGLGSVYHSNGYSSDSPADYSKAIYYYQKVLEIEKDNILSLNNLADIFVNGPKQVRNYQRALDLASKVLKIIPVFYDAKYYQGVALNRMNKPDKYLEAKNILQSIIDDNQLEDSRHWILYELSIINSKMGIDLKQDDLKQMLLIAKKYGDDEIFLSSIADPEEQAQFKPDDIDVIRDFLTNNLVPS
jgi:tetratricopeptide (TPR) repeat protein